MREKKMFTFRAMYSCEGNKKKIMMMNVKVNATKLTKDYKNKSRQNSCTRCTTDQKRGREKKKKKYMKIMIKNESCSPIYGFAFRMVSKTLNDVQMLFLGALHGVGRHTSH